MTTFEELVADYEMTGLACPAQYEGHLHDGRRFYFRFRFGVASLSIYAVDGPDEDPGRTSLQYGDSLAGHVTDEEFKELFVRLFTDRPEVAA